ncbi:hypothetical protein [Edaphobacter bradus]|uniref:hypothetical protein n=1 Tax=Edaphobacter bradus TaxID=2259016 RepID=UPI0021DF50F6|nr:hypothetical protein [Edaphobacter bradus]
MVPRTKMILMNLAVAGAIIYRWLHGSPTVPLIITGLIMFPLVNILMVLAAKNSALSKK